MFSVSERQIMKISQTGRSLARFGKEYRIIEGDMEMTGYFYQKNGQYTLSK